MAPVPKADLSVVAAKAMRYWSAGWTMNEISAEINISLPVIRRALRSKGIDTSAHMTRDRSRDHGSWRAYEDGCRCEECLRGHATRMQRQFEAVNASVPARVPKNRDHARQEASQVHAIHRGEPWTPEEVLACVKPDGPLAQVALDLGRSYNAVLSTRAILNNPNNQRYPAFAELLRQARSAGQHGREPNLADAVYPRDTEAVQCRGGASAI